MPMRKSKKKSSRRSLELEELHIVDSQNRMRMFMSTWEGSDDPVIQMYNSKGIPRITIGLESNGIPDGAHVVVMYPNGRSGIVLRMADHGRVAIGLFRDDGTEVFVAQIDINGEAQVRPMGEKSGASGS